MPSPTTAADLIARSMRLAKVLADGETPSASEAQDALAVLNDCLESWSTEPLSLWGQTNQTFNLVGGQASYTMGVGGNFNAVRPVRINGAFVRFAGEDYPLQIVDQLSYNDLSPKTQQQPIPEQLLYVPEVPLGVITLWPVPSQALPLVLSADRVMSTVPDLATVLTLPPGAALALRYQLALQLATEYGVPVSGELVALATNYKADYKRANKRQWLARFDTALQCDGGFADWRTGA